MQIRSIQLLFILLLLNTQSFAQGISRSNGIGMRIGSWNITNHPTRVSSSGYGKDGSVDIGGAGVWFYYFSRLNNNLFLELNLGAVGGAHEEHSNYIIESTEATAIIPFLLGFRYDLLSPKIPSSLLPYISFGGGPYWITKVETKNKYFVQDETVIESGQETGAPAQHQAQAGTRQARAGQARAGEARGGQRGARRAGRGGSHRRHASRGAEAQDPLARRAAQAWRGRGGE